jgi:DNA-binding NarL/FixJ family response regulator
MGAGMKQIIKVLIVDDQVLFREALQTLLSVQPDIDVIGQAGNGEEALRIACQRQPDVVLMDLRMPVMDGVTATSRLKSTLPACKVIALTTFDDNELVFNGLRAGAVGYLLKDVSSDKLFEAIRAAARGEYFLLPSITAKVVEEFARITPPSASFNNIPEHFSDLSPREIEILKIAATGASNKEIAEKLVIAEGTVKNHMRNILSKLDAKDRMQAVLMAKEFGII